MARKHQSRDRSARVQAVAPISSTSPHNDHARTASGPTLFEICKRHWHLNQALARATDAITENAVWEALWREFEDYLDRCSDPSPQDWRRRLDELYATDEYTLWEEDRRNLEYSLHRRATDEDAWLDNLGPADAALYHAFERDFCSGFPEEGDHA